MFICLSVHPVTMLRFLRGSSIARRNVCSKIESCTLLSDYPHIAKSLKLEPINSGVFYGSWENGQSDSNMQFNPSTGHHLASVKFGNQNDYHKAVAAMDSAKPLWENVPAPIRGEVVRKIGDRLRLQKTELGTMISLEMGKILAEGLLFSFSLQPPNICNN